MLSVRGISLSDVNKNPDSDKIQNDRYLKALDFIQRCVTRMADNSTKAKRWLSALLILFIGIVGRENGIVNASVFVVVIVMVLMFWGLDAYYLTLERLYRERYELLTKDHAFSMDDFILNPRKFSNVDPKRYASRFYRKMLESGLSRMNLIFYSGSMALMIFAGLQYSLGIDICCSLLCSLSPVLIAIVVRVFVS